VRTFVAGLLCSTHDKDENEVQCLPGVRNRCGRAGLGAQPILTALPVQNPKAGGQEVRLTMWQGETSRQMLLPAMLVEWLFGSALPLLEWVSEMPYSATAMASAWM